MAGNYLLFSEVVSHLEAQEEAWLKLQLQWIAVHGKKETDIDGPDDEATQNADWFGPRFLRDYEDYDPSWECLGFEYAFHDDHDTPDGWGRHLWLYADESGKPAQVAWLVRKFLRRFRPDQCWSLTYATTCSKPRVGEFGGGALFVTADRTAWQNAYDFVETEREAFFKDRSKTQRALQGARENSEKGETNDGQTTDTES